MDKTGWFDKYISQMNQRDTVKTSQFEQNLIEYEKQNNDKLDNENEIELLVEQFQTQTKKKGQQTKLQMKIQANHSKRAKKESKANCKQLNQIEQYLCYKSLVKSNGFPKKETKLEQNKSQSSSQLLKYTNSQDNKPNKQIQSKLTYWTKVQLCNKCSKKKRLMELLSINQFYCCQQCCLDGLNPLPQILRKLKSIRYVTEGKNNEINYNLDYFELDTDTQLEIRCVQTSQQGMSEITFPQNCVLRLNGCVLKYFKPRNVTDQIQKRHDQPVIIDNQFFQKYLSKVIEFVFSIEQLQSNDTNVMCDKPGITRNYQRKDFIENSLRQQFIPKHEQQDINKTKVELSCCFSNQTMKYPARGIFCAHFQCFCLKKFLEFQIQSKNNQKWFCPICKQPLIEIVIDKLQFQATTLIRKQLLEDGSIDFNFKNQHTLNQPQIDKEETQNINQISEIIIV